MAAVTYGINPYLYVRGDKWASKAKHIHSGQDVVPQLKKLIQTLITQSESNFKKTTGVSAKDFTQSLMDDVKVFNSLNTVITGFEKNGANVSEAKVTKRMTSALKSAGVDVAQTAKYGYNSQILMDYYLKHFADWKDAEKILKSNTVAKDFQKYLESLVADKNNTIVIFEDILVDLANSMPPIGAGQDTVITLGLNNYKDKKKYLGHYQNVINQINILLNDIRVNKTLTNTEAFESMSDSLFQLQKVKGIGEEFVDKNIARKEFPKFIKQITKGTISGRILSESTGTKSETYIRDLKTGDIASQFDGIFYEVLNNTWGKKKKVSREKLGYIDKEADSKITFNIKLPDGSKQKTNLLISSKIRNPLISKNVTLASSTRIISLMQSPIIGAYMRELATSEDFLNAIIFGGLRLDFHIEKDNDKGQYSIETGRGAGQKHVNYLEVNKLSDGALTKMLAYGLYNLLSGSVSVGNGTIAGVNIIMVNGYPIPTPVYLKQMLERVASTLGKAKGGIARHDEIMSFSPAAKTKIISTYVGNQAPLDSYRMIYMAKRRSIRAAAEVYRTRVSFHGDMIMDGMEIYNKYLQSM